MNIRKVGILLLLLSLGITIGGHIEQYNSFNLLQLFRDIYSNIGSELGSIAITILIVDELIQRREMENHKKRLVRQLGNPSNGIAIQVIKDLKMNNGLYDGALRGAVLSLAGLQRIDLAGADFESAILNKADFTAAVLDKANLKNTSLKGAILVKTKMRMTDLSGADLSHADLYGADIANAIFSNSTIMPDGSYWESNTDIEQFVSTSTKAYKLQGDFEVINETGYSGDPVGVATSLRVSEGIASIQRAVRKKMNKR